MGEVGILVVWVGVRKKNSLLVDWFGDGWSVQYNGGDASFCLMDEVGSVV